MLCLVNKRRGNQEWTIQRHWQRHLYIFRFRQINSYDSEGNDGCTGRPRYRMVISRCLHDELEIRNYSIACIFLVNKLKTNYCLIFL